VEEIVVADFRSLHRRGYISTTMRGDCRQNIFVCTCDDYMLPASIKYQWKRNRLLAKQARTGRQFNLEIEKAHKNGEARDKIESRRADAYFEYSYAQEQIDELVTNHMIAIAKKLMIEQPEYSDDSMWAEARYVGRNKILSEKGIAKLRSDIRKERNERVNLWIPWITTIIGLVGALTGLMAILMK